MKRDVPTGKSFTPPRFQTTDWLAVEVSLALCRFPKHDGKSWLWIVENDPDYIHWLLSGEGPALSLELTDKLTELLEEHDA